MPNARPYRMVLWPTCDIFNLGRHISSYFHVPLTTVCHLYNVDERGNQAAAFYTVIQDVNCVRVKTVRDRRWLQARP